MLFFFFKQKTAYEMRISDWSSDVCSSDLIGRFINRLTLFLTLVGLTALLVGGVGVGNAVRSYLEGKTATIATLKCLGAPGRLIFQVYMAQILALALVGIVVGRSEEHTSEQSLMRISYAVFCLKKKKKHKQTR